MDDLGHLLLDLTDLLAQPFYGGLDLAEPFGEPGAARNSWPGRFTEPVVKEMPDLARHPKQCAKRAPQSHQRGCYRASAHDPQSERRGVRGMHRPLQYPFRRFPLCGMSLLYNQYASLASRWPAHEDMLTLKGVRKYKGPGQLQGLRPGPTLAPLSGALCQSVQVLPPVQVGAAPPVHRLRPDVGVPLPPRLGEGGHRQVVFGRVFGERHPLGGGGVGQGQTAGELGEVGFPVRVGRFAASAGAGADRAREVLAALVSAQDAWRRGRPPPRPHLLSQAGVTAPRLGGPHPRTARTSPPAATPTARGTPPAWSPPQRTIPGHPRGGHGRPGTGSGRSAARTAAPPPPVPPDPRESAPTPPADGTPR